MYIYVFEDLEVRYSVVDPSAEDFEQADDGYLDIIKLPTNGHDGPPLRWWGGKWEAIKKMSPDTEIDD